MASNPETTGKPEDFAIDDGRGSLLLHHKDGYKELGDNGRNIFIDQAILKHKTFTETDALNFAVQIQEFLDQPENESGNFFTTEDIQNSDPKIREKIARSLVEFAFAADLGIRNGIHFFELQRKVLANYGTASFGQSK